MTTPAPVPWSPAPPIDPLYAVMRWPTGAIFAGPLALCRALPEGSILRVCPRADALRAVVQLPLGTAR